MRLCKNIATSLLACLISVATHAGADIKYFQLSKIELQPMAEEGDTAAQFHLAIKWINDNKDREGKSEQIDTYLLNAFKADYPPALFHIGNTLIKQSKTEGFNLIKEAAEMGSESAQLFLYGAYSISGNGFASIDHDAGSDWLIRASQGEGKDAAIALFILSDIISNGENVALQNKTQEDFKRVMTEKYSPELIELASSIPSFSHNGILYDMALAAMGEADGQYRMGMHYLGGRSKVSFYGFEHPVPSSFKKSIRYLKQSASNESSEANFRLGEVYADPLINLFSFYDEKTNSVPVEANPILARAYFKKAAELGSEDAANKLSSAGTYDVGTWGESSSHTTYNELDFTKTYYDAEIAFSVNGGKNLYLQERKFNGRVCEPSQHNGNDISFWHFDNQPVSMFVFCEEIDENSSVYYATPKSDAGVEYVVGAFSRAPSVVNVKIGDRSVPFSAVGFTKAWRGAGGDAL
ncbi:MAG: hypothetical protein ACQEUN_12240 [Pseudomonadota bacterium]